MDDKLNPCLNQYSGNDFFCIFVKHFTDNENFWPEPRFFRDKTAANDFIQSRKKLDCYNSISDFNVPGNRKEINVKTVYEHFIDIDDHTTGMTKAEAIAITNEMKKYYNNEIPEPSSIVYTGRGFQIHFNIYGTTDVVKWRYTQEALLNKIDEIIGKINAIISVNWDVHSIKNDRLTDSNRVLRIPGTRNTRVNVYAETIYNSGKIYTQNDIIENYNLTYFYKKKERPLSELSELDQNSILNAKPEKLRNYLNKNKAFTLEYLKEARINDLAKLIMLRNNAGIYEGYRNMLIKIACELYRATTKDINYIYERLQELNSMFIKPLPDNDVKYWAAMKLKYAGYYYRNRRIVEVLNISEEEQRQLKVLHSRKMVNADYYNNHREKIKEAKRTAKRNKYKAIKDTNTAARQMMIDQARAMRKAGYTMEAIAIELKVNKSTVSRWMKIENRENRVNQ